MKKSEVAEIFNKVCGVKFPFFENNYKLSNDEKVVSQRRETMMKAKKEFKDWQKHYEDYLTRDTTKDIGKNDKLSHLINAYNKSKINDDKALVISIIDKWFNSLVFAKSPFGRKIGKSSKAKLWKEYNDGKWINEDIANMLNDCFESIKYYRQFNG